MARWLVLIPIFLPWIGAALLRLVSDKSPRLQHGLAVAFSLAAGAGALALLPATSATVVLDVPLGSVFGDFTLVPDALGVFLAAIATVVGSLAVIFSIDYMRGEAELGRYYSLILLFIGAMAGLVLSGSLLMMFAFWEVTAFCSYALISFYNDDPKAVRGGLKALIITQIGGVGLLVGALVARAQMGTYQISALLEGADRLPAGALAVIAFSFLIAAAAKSAQFPFHTWLPDAMEAPTPISALIHAATMVNAGIYLMARFFPIFAGVPGWQITVICMGLVSALVGAVQALTAWDLKRVLAYSTISQLGYLMYANGVGAVFQSQFHLFSHALFKALLFLSAGAIIHALGSRDMRDMRGLGAQMPFVRVVFVIGTLGLVGLPIANGFFSKDLILEAGLEHGPIWAYVGMLIGVGLTALYSARMLTLALFTPGEQQKHLHDASAAMRVSLAVLALGTLTSWLLVGGFSGSLAATLPFHHLEEHALGAVIGGILGHLGTWIALACVAIGIGLWFLREHLAVPAALSDFLTRAGAQDFGLGWVNQAIVTGTTRAAEALRRTQTGYLNWNVFGILGALVIVLGLIFWGSR